MANFCKALLCTVCFVVLAGNAHAQVPPTSPDGSQPEWKEYFGKIENIDTGKYDIIFREVGTNCVSNTEPVEISLREIPAAPVVSNITYPTCAEATGSVVLSGLPEGNWIINPVNISGSGQTATITGLTAGQSYAFTVTSDKCTSEPSVLVSFDPAPLTPDPPTAEAQTLCAGSHVSDLEPHYTSENQIRWYSQTGGSTPLATDTELESGTYYATVLSDGCESARTAVQINIIPQVTPEVTINSNNAEICQGEEASFFAMVREGATGESYQWFLNNEPTDIKSSTFTSSTLNNGNTLSCLVSVTGTCVLETQVMSEVLTVSFNPKITVEAKDITKCGDLIGSFTALGLDPNKQYEYQLIPKNQTGKPVITLLGDNPLYWNVGETFIDPGATAYDEKDEDITSDIVVVSTVDVNTEGSYQITYNVTDSDGNAAEEVVRSVVVEEGIDWTYEGVLNAGYLFSYDNHNYGYTQASFGSILPTPSDLSSIFYRNSEGYAGVIMVGFASYYVGNSVLLQVNGINYELFWDGLSLYYLDSEFNPFSFIGSDYDVKVKWTTPSPVFEEVTIGTQTWMAKNLDIDDGLGGIYVYGGNENNPDYDYNLTTYGRLYTWDAAMRIAATVEGWHLPTKEEWDTLSGYLGGNNVSGGKLKETGTTHWLAPNTGATNESGFTALGAGDRSVYGIDYNLKIYSFLWSATEDEYDSTKAYERHMNYNYSGFPYGREPKTFRLSVRLIKD